MRYDYESHRGVTGVTLQKPASACFAPLRVLQSGLLLLCRLLLVLAGDTPSHLLRVRLGSKSGRAKEGGREAGGGGRAEAAVVLEDAWCREWSWGVLLSSGAAQATRGGSARTPLRSCR